MNQGHVGGNLRGERSDHVPIDLDRGQVPHQRRKPQCQSARPRADLDESLVNVRVDDRDEFLGRGTLQKVLTEPFLGAHLCNVQCSMLNYSSRHGTQH